MKYALIYGPKIGVPCYAQVCCSPLSMPILFEFHHGGKEEYVVYMDCFHLIKIQNVTLFHYTSM